MSADNGAHGQSDATSENTASSTDASLNARVKTTAKRGPSRWLWVLVAGLAAIAIIIGAVKIWGGRNDKTGDALTPTQAQAVTIGLKLAPTNLDIRNQSGSTLDQILIGNVYEGLVARNSKNEVVAGLAESWGVSEDGLTYTFNLAKDRTFSNGDALDADDVVWSIRQLVEKQYKDSELLANFQSIEAKDSSTVVLTLSKPYANLLWGLTGRPGLVFDKDAQYDAKTQAVGSGPYLVDSFRSGDAVVLKANPKYDGKNKPKTSVITLRFLADDNAAVNALKSGDVQVLAPINDTLAADFKDNPDYVVKAGEDTDKYVLAMNGAKGRPTSDKRVRQAIRYAIDHKALIAARGGVDKELGGPIPSLDPGYEDLTGLYPHDTAKAKELLAKAGYSTEHPLSLTLTYANTYGTELGDQLRSQLKEVGVDLTVNVVEFSTWLQDVHSDKNYDLSLVDHNESHDFYQWADPDYYYNYNNSEVQSLYAQAMAAADQNESDDLLARAARLVSEDAAGDWLFNYRVTSAWVKGVTGFPVDLNQTLLPLWNLEFRR